MSVMSISNKLRNRVGFTLLEMIVVVLIISILASIAIPAYMKARENSKTRLCRTHLRHLQEAKERWAMEHKKIDTDIPTFDDLVPNYVKDVPQCPSSGVYDLKSVGEDATCTTPDHTMY